MARIRRPLREDIFVRGIGLARVAPTPIASHPGASPSRLGRMPPIRSGDAIANHHVLIGRERTERKGRPHLTPPLGFEGREEGREPGGMSRPQIRGPSPWMAPSERTAVARRHPGPHQGGRSPDHSFRDVAGEEERGPTREMIRILLTTAKGSEGFAASIGPTSARGHDLGDRSCAGLGVRRIP
jgi:hypothetical protein